MRKHTWLWLSILFQQYSDTESVQISRSAETWFIVIDEYVLHVFVTAIWDDVLCTPMVPKSLQGLLTTCLLRPSRRRNRGTYRLSRQRRSRDWAAVEATSAAACAKKGISAGACSVRRNWYRSLNAAWSERDSSGKLLHFGKFPKKFGQN